MRLYARGNFPINSLLKMDKGFVGGYDDTWHFTCSVGSHALSRDELSKKHPSEIMGYRWNGSFMLRVGNTRINLHEPVPDEGLFKLEKKLTLLRDNLNKYVNEIEARHKKPGSTVYNDRCWLNPVEWQNDYTGYTSAYIAEDGHSRISIADCHKAISLWVNAPTPEEGDSPDEVVAFLSKVDQDQIGLLRGIASVVSKGIDQIDLLRASFTKALQQSREMTRAESTK